MTEPEVLRGAVGGRLKAIVDEFGTLTGMAKNLNIGASTLHRWINGETTPTAEQLLAIADATGASIAWIVSGRGPKYRRELLFNDQGRLTPVEHPTNEPSQSPLPFTASALLAYPPLSAGTKRLDRLQNANLLRRYMYSLLAEITAVCSQGDLDLARRPAIDHLTHLLRTAADALQTAMDATDSEAPTDPPDESATAN